MKHKIQSRFNASSQSYDKVASVQRESADFLIAQFHNHFPDFLPQSILDLGTGTGYAAEKLLRYYPYAHYTLNDLSSNMLQATAKKFSERKNISFHHGDMETEKFKDHDLIISNLALQWTHNLEKMLHTLHQQSKVFAFSCLLDGTFKEWKTLLKDYGVISNPLRSYPCHEKMMDTLGSLQSPHLHHYVKDFELVFPDAYAFASYLKHLGASFQEGDFHYSSFIKMIREHKEEIRITYCVFFGIMMSKS